jgi:hypothetical protein
MPTPSCCDRLTLRVVLLKVSPLVARLISVPYDLSLEELHDVLQLVLGWPKVLRAAKTYANEPLKPALTAVFCTFEG